MLAMFGQGCRQARSPQTVADQIQFLFEHGKLDEAATEADQALNEYGGDPVWLWRFRIQKARILVYRSAWQDALAALSQDPPKTLAAPDVRVRRSMVQAMAYRVGQEFDKADQKLEEAESLAPGSEPRILCEVLNARASLEGSEGNYAKAETSYSAALGLARQYNNSYQEVAALVGLAWVATNQHKYDEAAERDLAVLSLARARGMQALAATTMGNLAWNYGQLGDFEAALDFYKQGGEQSAKIGMSGYSAYWFSGVAGAYMSLHEYGPAEELAVNTLKQARALKDASTTTVCLNTLADIMLRTDRNADAERFNQEALHLVASGEEKVNSVDTWATAGRVYAAKKDFSAAEPMFKRVLADPNADAEHRWASYAGLARIKDGESDYGEAEQLFLKAINTIEQARQSVNHDELRLSFLTSGIEIYGEYIDFLMRRGRPADALKEAELSRARTLEEGLSTSAKSVKAPSLSVPPEQVAERLKATLLFYWMGGQQSYLWVITPKETKYFTLPAADRIDPVVKSYSAGLLGTRDPLESGDNDGQKLYTVLIEPARKFIPANSRVIVLPDGSLYGLNFDTLIASEPKPHYWIEDVTLSTASSLTLLSSSAATHPTAKDNSLFLVGDTLSPNDSFPKLIQAPDEMKGVERYFPASRTTVLSGAAATPAAYLSSNPAQYRYLHFVTHGTASRTRPLESAVILSKEKDGESYKLYARDIVTRRLNANLVTISACNTSGTRTFSGEGLVGLSWAFLRAGAHNVIGALWEVSDASTPQLMDKLYEGLSRGEDPGSALRHAKLGLLHSDGVFKKPRYWGPFQLYTGS